MQALHGREWVANAAGPDICSTVVNPDGVPEDGSVVILHHLPSTATDGEVRTVCERGGSVLRVTMADVQGGPAPRSPGTANGPGGQPRMGGPGIGGGGFDPGLGPMPNPLAGASAPRSAP